MDQKSALLASYDTTLDPRTFAATKDVYAVLSVNPGVTAPKGLFDYVGHGGGSEPGVLDLTWLLRRTSDQSWVFYSVGWNDAINPHQRGKSGVPRERGTRAFGQEGLGRVGGGVGARHQ